MNWSAETSISTACIALFRNGLRHAAMSNDMRVKIALTPTATDGEARRSPARCLMLEFAAGA